VLYYNKDAFKKAGLNPDQPPKTWQDMAAYTEKLRQSGVKCGYASGWQGWIQIENFSAWHALPIATKNNGFDGTDAVLEFNKPLQVKHIQTSKSCRFTKASMTKVWQQASRLTVAAKPQRFCKFMK